MQAARQETTEHRHEPVVAAATSRAEPRLDARERRILSAAIERVLPSDDGPGAVETGCADYVIEVIETRLTTTAVAKMRRGLDFAESLARQGFQDDFADLPAGHQNKVLRQLQRMPHPTLQFFLHRLVELTLEGFLCHPRHGGNRGGAGWRYLGLEDSDSADPCDGGDEPCMMY